MTSQTQAGQNNFDNEINEEYFKVINEVFALFRVNYHNQYNSAYKDDNFTNNTKALWGESLSRFDHKTLINAAKKIIRESEFLPTLNKMIKSCNELKSTTSLPNVHTAYREACNAPSPKRNATWTHPAVYYAGKQTDWFFLANNTEKTAFPIFKSHYERLCQRIINGETLPQLATLALPEETNTPLSKEENKERMEKLRQEMGI